MKWAWQVIFWCRVRSTVSVRCPLSGILSVCNGMAGMSCSALPYYIYVEMSVISAWFCQHARRLWLKILATPLAHGDGRLSKKWVRHKGVENRCKSRTEFSFENVIMTGAYLPSNKTECCCKIREKVGRSYRNCKKNWSTDPISRDVLKSETKQSVSMEWRREK